MSLESFLPEGGHGKVTILDKAIGVLDRLRKQKSNYEIYNSDKTKKFTFNKYEENDFVSIGVGLLYRLGEGWGEIMAVRASQEGENQKFIGLRVEAINDVIHRPLEMFVFDLHTGGFKDDLNTWSWSMEIDDNKLKEEAGKKGFFKATELPQFVDFEKTAREFLLHAKKLDFSNPVLYPKEHLNEGQIQLNP